MTDHLTCIGASAMELGAFTPFLYFLKAREWLYELLEKVSGARLTHSYVRVGGVVKDLPDDFDADLTLCLDQIEKVMVEVEGDAQQQQDLPRPHGRHRRDDEGGRDRAPAASVRSRARAGVDYDVRKDYPYSIYPELEFDVPVGTTGDCLDRYLVRIEELKQSIRILRQCLKQIPDGPVMVDDHRVALPPKRDTYNTIESMIRHFKHIMDGIQRPGRRGVRVRRGRQRRARLLRRRRRHRPPVQGVLPVAVVRASLDGRQLIHGHLIADVVPIFGMINMIGGECDK